MAYREKDTKKWTAQWFETNVMGEKKKRRKRGFETKREALEFERSKKLSSERSMDMKLSDFIEIYFSDKQNDLKDRTIKNKRYMMQQHIVPYFGNQMMSEIKASQIIQWQNEIQKKGYSDSYLRMIQNQLTSLFTHAAKIYDLPVNPCKKVKRMGNSDSRSLNFWTLDEYKQLSKAYDHVITNHKMTLLLHVIDGLYEADKHQLQAVKQEIKNKYPESRKGNVGDYMAAVYSLCKKYFFSYHRKYACGIMPLLKVTSYKFMARLSETRNWYSHFLSESKKPLRIVKGRDFIIYFELVCYMIRLSVIDRIGVPISESRVQEFYYTVHDWILAIMYDADEPLKSNTYKIEKQWKKFIREIEELQKEALNNENSQDVEIPE